MENALRLLEITDYVQPNKVRKNENLKDVLIPRLLFKVAISSQTLVKKQADYIYHEINISVQILI